jgi:glycosyltransferase involved in cell wall biosynthesis
MTTMPAYNRITTRRGRNRFHPDFTSRVLTVLPDFPFPATTGLHLRMAGNLQLVRRLGCFSSVLYFSTEASTEERISVANDITFLAEVCDEIRHAGQRIPHDEFSPVVLLAHKADFLLRGALGMTGRRYPFSMSYDCMDAEELIAAEAEWVEADFVILPSIFMHYAIRLRALGFGVILDAPDVLTHLTASFLRHFTGRGGKLGLWANHVACRTQQRVALPRCTELWATSPAEAEQFREIAPGTPTVVVPNCFDEEKMRPATQCNEPVIGFIGTYSYAPNLQAAELLAERVFPQVLDRCPAAVLKIAGQDMPLNTFARLKRMKNVEVLGKVEDSGRFMAECSVLALPVFVRGGVPLKLVEAMARGKAIVATPELAQNLAIIDGEDLLIRAGANLFSAALARLLCDSRLRQRLGVNARATFLREFSRARAESNLRRDSVLAGAREATLLNPNRSYSA